MRSHFKLLNLLHFNPKEEKPMEKYFSIYSLLCYAYKTLIRKILLKAIDDPDQSFDDVIMALLDKLFNYEEPK